MEVQRIDHYQINGKYSIKITKAAGVKTGLGYEIEAHGDDLNELREDIIQLKTDAELLTPTIPMPVAEKEGK